jgi:cell pole-organizing protein PopZ
MSEQTSQEPTMEEILASIRRIISEDDAPPADGEEAAPAAEEPVAVAVEAEPEPEPAPEPLAFEPEPVAAVEPEPAPVEEEALELTEKVETHGDLDVFPATAPEPVAAAPELRPSVENLVSERAASAAASSFGALSAAILMPKGDRTLEDVVRELLRPMLQQWLDENLPAIVQQAVETEVDRIARGRVR